MVWLPTVFDEGIIWSRYFPNGRFALPSSSIVSGHARRSPSKCGSLTVFRWGPADAESRLYAKSYSLLGARNATEPRSR
ncbi:hypothetical protein SCLCIDRAFT_1218873, partial [Scleroderma citrinum Foug A]